MCYVDTCFLLLLSRRLILLGLKVIALLNANYARFFKKERKKEGEREK